MLINKQSGRDVELLVEYLRLSVYLKFFFTTFFQQHNFTIKACYYELQLFCCSFSLDLFFSN